MDNLTHSLVGLVGAKAGLERASPRYATAVCVLAANGPDADVIATLGGQWFYLEHHRGITHSIVGTLALAFVIPLLCWGGDRLAARWRGSQPQAHFGGLLLASLLLSASHPLLDWTNNYGVRPWLPWDGRWFYGDLVFIIDLWLWLALGGAVFLLTARKAWRMAAWAALTLCVTLLIFILPRRSGVAFPVFSQALWLAGVAGLIVVRQTKWAERFGPRLAASALALVVVYWGALALLHTRALTRARATAAVSSQQSGEMLLRVAAMPVLADPLSWRAVAETNRAFYRFQVSAVGVSEAAGWPPAERFPKPQGADAERAGRAAQDWRAQSFLGFSRFPATLVETNCPGQSLVQFADLRFTEPGRARGGAAGGSFHIEVTIPHAPAN